MSKIPVSALRRPKAYTTPYCTNLIHLRSPWVTLLWSAMFPGLGHLILGSYIKGWLLVIWEFFINLQTNLNVAIVYSFTGGFAQAKAALEPKWLLLYIPVYIYGLWDTYRTTIDLNKYAFLAEAQKPSLTPFSIGLLEIHYFGKRHPWGALLWSALLPGLGHLYTHQLLTGFFILTAYVVSVYQANFLLAVQASFMGEFAAATALADPQWLLFLPSLYGFALHDSYTHTVEYNKLFDTEQALYLQRAYQDKQFEMPL